MIIILEKEDLQKKVKKLSDADYHYTLSWKTFKKATSVYVTDGYHIKILKQKDIMMTLDPIKPCSNLLTLIREELGLSFKKSVVAMAKRIKPDTVARTIREIELDAFDRT